MTTPETTGPKKPLLAYSVIEEDEGTGGILFARSSAEARRLGAAIWSSGEWEYVKARRAQWADQYAPGPIPLKAYMDAGWWHECAHCGQKVSNDAYDDDGEPVELDPCGDFESLVFCNQTHAAEFEADKRAAQKTEQDSIERLTQRITTLCPGIEIIGSHAYARKKDGIFVAVQTIVRFNFPGSAHGPGEYRLETEGTHACKDGEPIVTIPKGDLDAWERFRGREPAHVA